MKKRVRKLINRWLADRYGSRRGFILTYIYRFLYFIGRYQRYKQIDWNLVERLVFICKGNICRSAFAEAVARSLEIETISCGIDTTDGVSANSKAILAAKKRGLDLDQHQTQKITSIEAKSGDLFVVMEPCQAKHLQEMLADRYPHTLLGLWGSPVTPYIHDPYSSDEVYFDTCFAYIQDSVRSLANKLARTPYRS